jgi:hypothetical protein
VAGRINKIGANGWQVSAAMLDAESGVTKNAETIRHQGDVFGLLNDKIPVLAGALAGGTGAPGGSPPPAAAALQPPAGAAARKLAIFPAALQGQNAKDLERNAGHLDDAIVKMLRGDNADVTVTHRMSDNALLGKDVWSGLISKDPDMDVVFRRAKDLGVNLVLMYQSRSDPSNREFKMFLIDAENLRRYERSGNWKPGDNQQSWVPTLSRAANALVIEYKLTQATHWPNPPKGAKLTENQLRELLSRPVTFYYLVPDSVGTIEYLPGGQTVVRHPGGRGEGKWRLTEDRVCVTPSNAPEAKEACSNRFNLGNGIYRAGDDSGKSYAVLQIKP